MTAIYTALYSRYCVFALNDDPNTISMLNAPFRLAPYFRTRIWGARSLAPWYDYTISEADEPIGEVWLTGDQCVAETGPCAGMTLDEITQRHAPELLGAEHALERQFPLLMKVLFPREKLSVQVHPDDAMAQKYGEPRGKTECWYALEAEPDASVALGLKPGVTPESVKAAVEDRTMEQLLKWLPVHKGDMFFVDAGTVHAIAPGSVLLETQQNSDLTYRLYDYGRPRELHVEKSLEAMRLSTRAGRVEPRVQNGCDVLVESEYFRVERFAFGSHEKRTVAGDGLQIWFAAAGEGVVTAGTESIHLSRGQVIVVPATCGGMEVTSAQGMEMICATRCSSPASGADVLSLGS